MANTIILKKSSVVGKVPLSGDLTFGEVALNYADGKIYYKNTSTNIDFVGNGGTFTNTLSITNTTQSISTTTGALTVAGGVGIGGQLNVGGTTSTFASKVSIGTTFSGSPLVVAAQTSTNIVTALSGTLLHLIGGNSSNNRITIDSFGGYSVFSGRSARGTADSPSAVQANDLITEITARGYGATGYGADSTAKIGFYASENFSDSAKGTYLKFKTTPAGSTTAIDRLTIEDTGELVISHLGATNSIALNNPILIATSDANSFVQINMQNKSTGISASADYVATADDGDDTTNYIALGINNSGYSNAGWTISGPRDGYLYVAGNNLTLGTDTEGKEVRIHVGGTLAEDVVAIFREPGTASTSDITGSFNVDGGVGITGDTHIGTTLYIGPNPANLANSLLLGTANLDDYAQISIQNQNNGPNASADFVITADDGDDETNYLDLGLNNSGYTAAGWTVSGPRDGYLYVANNSLTLGTDSTGTTVKVHVGGTLEENIVATFNEANTQATTTNTGALVVTGGVGISQDLVVGGTIYGDLTGTATDATNISVGLATQVLYKNASNITTGSASLIFDETVLKAPQLNSTNSQGDEGGEILLAKPQTNSTIAGTGVTIDVYQNKLRFFEQGGSARGFYIDITTGGASVGTDLVGGGASGVTSITAGTDTSVSASTGAVTIWNTSTLQTITSRGATTNQAISITNSTSATSTTTGALQVIGGAGIGSNVVVGGYGRFNGEFNEAASTTTIGLYVGVAGSAPASPRVAFANSGTTWQIDNYNGNFRWFIPGTTRMQIDTSGNLSVYANTNSTSTTTGALIVTGGAGIGSNLYVGGTIFGTVTTATSAAIAYSLANTSTTYVGRAVLADSVGTLTNPLIVTNLTQSTSTTTGALIVSGGIGVGGNAHIGGNIVVKNTAIVGDASTTSVLTSAVTLDTFAAATYRSAQYIVSVSNAGLGEYQTSDVLIVHNGTNSFVQATSVFSGNKVIMNFSTTISGGNVLLQGTGSGTGANPNIVKIQKTYITI